MEWIMMMIRRPPTMDCQCSASTCPRDHRLPLERGRCDGARAEGEDSSAWQRLLSGTLKTSVSPMRLERIDGNWIEMTSKFFFGGSRYREPNEPLQVQTRERQISTIHLRAGFV